MASRSMILAGLLAMCLLSQATAYATFYQGLQAQGNTVAVQATNKLGLKNTLSNKNLKLTVLVPSQAAFNSLSKQYGISQSAVLQQTNLLRQVIYLHFIDGSRTVAQLKGKKWNTFLKGKTITVAANGRVYGPQGSASFTGRVNVKCGAGYAHEINNVLLPFRIGGK